MLNSLLSTSLGRQNSAKWALFDLLAEVTTPLTPDVIWLPLIL